MPESINLTAERLRRLPAATGEVWQGGWIRLPAWIQDEDAGGSEPFRPKAALWISVPRRQIHMSRPVPPAKATPELLLRTAAEFAEGKLIGGHRPEALEVKDAALAEELTRTLGDAGIGVWVREQLASLDAAMADLNQSMDPDAPRGPLAAEGMTPDRLRAFADAAAAFYRAAPWQHLTDDDLIQIEAPKPPKGMAFATVLGGGGKSFGLGFFSKRADHNALREEGDPSAIFRGGPPWSLQFDPIDKIPFPDADAWEAGGLPLAAPNAYPVLLQYRPTGGAGRADAKTTAFAEGLLRALADTSEQEMDGGRWEKTVEAADGSVTYKLSLPDLLEAQSPAGKVRRGGDSDLPADPQAMMERMMSQIGRLLDERGIDSIEEANEFLEKNVMGRDPGELLGPEADRELTPVQRAQDLVYQARESRGRRELQLAREALAISPDCADAYVLLAERKSDPHQSAELYAQGVAAGERALKQEYGDDFFEEEVGNFWGILETRPYMRARQGLAMRLADAGRLDEAIGHYRELLRLNPGDNQGIRYLLLPLLLRAGRFAEADDLANRGAYEEEASAVFEYVRALLAFREHGGDSAAAKTTLADAIESNRHVPKYLLGRSALPVLSPSYISPGEDSEACDAALGLLDVWRATPGATAWLAAHTPRGSARRGGARKGKGKGKGGGGKRKRL